MGKHTPTETASRLTSAREASGLSSERLSILVGASASTLPTFERGQTRQLRLSTLIACADLLGVPVSWLLAGTGKMPAASRIRDHVARQTVAAAPPEAT